MSQVLIQQYLNHLQDLRKAAGTGRESVVREAFKDLLKGWARAHDLIFVPDSQAFRPARAETAQDELLHKSILKADKDLDRIVVDSETMLTVIPSEAWDYRLGNRSALEWILDPYKEKKPKDPTIHEKFNTYRFAEYKEKVIDLLMRVTTVSVKTVGVVAGMKSLKRQRQFLTKDDGV